MSPVKPLPLRNTFMLAASPPRTHARSAHAARRRPPALLHHHTRGNRPQRRKNLAPQLTTAKTTTGNLGLNHHTITHRQIAWGPTRCVSRRLMAELLKNKLHAGVHLLNLSVLRLHCI